VFEFLAKVSIELASNTQNTLFLYFIEKKLYNIVISWKTACFACFLVKSACFGLRLAKKKNTLGV
jgi:hypothetical protein